MGDQGAAIWRVSPDGELRDTFRKMTNIFQMREFDFFAAYSNKGVSDVNYYADCDIG